MTEQNLLPHIEMQTGGAQAGNEPTATVIWLHGLGADGHDFEPIVPQLGLSSDVAIRFIFPHAPNMPVTLNGGFIMPAWYDLQDTEIGRQHDEQGILQSANSIQAFIHRENERGIANNRIILAGFSQGGAMALHIGLRQREALAGLLALSCYLPLPEKAKPEVQTNSLKTPVFMAHGTHDPVVGYSLGEQSRDTLQALGLMVNWHSYAMEHSVCPEEIKHIGQAINTMLMAEKRS